MAFQNYFSALCFKGENTNIGMLSLTPIPFNEWSFDFIQPRPVCIKKDDSCVSSTFVTPSESKKYHFEYEGEVSKNKTPVIVSNVTYVQLNGEEPQIQIVAKVQEPGFYVLVLQYYQPSYPSKSLLFCTRTENVFYCLS